MDQLLAVTNTAAKMCVTCNSVSFFIPVTSNFLRTLLSLEFGKVKKKPTPWSNCTVPGIGKSKKETNSMEHLYCAWNWEK
jgi:hypothetical protein